MTVQFEMVSCVQGSCMAVGYAATRGQTAAKALAERWNGHAWVLTKVHSMNLGTGHWNILDGVSCRGPHWCVATGFLAGPNRYPPLIEQWNGSRWHIVPAARSRTPHTLLGMVSCPSRSSCTTVGFAGGLVTASDGLTQTFAEHWSGARWLVQSTPGTGKGYDQLDAVSCATVTTCMAVGWSTTRTVDVLDGATLALIWRNGVWSITPSP